ncbi:MAG TPA: HisA/HisF-related TIM barrel protein [Candidatus Binataceae bacterium]
MSAPFRFDRFTVIPSIDLKDGEVVRLLRGDMNRATVYGSDPAATASAFAAAGARLIHVVDLDGAIAGEPRNLASVRAIRDVLASSPVDTFASIPRDRAPLGDRAVAFKTGDAVRCRLDVSGGLRSLDSIDAVIDAGADIISIGSAAFLEPTLITKACAKYPGRIFGSLDVRDGKLAIRGWVETSALTVAEAAIRFRDAGVAAVIVTDISRDGTETGANVALFAEAARLARVPVVASGGVASLGDLRTLKGLFDEGIVGAITGRALYEGRFSLSEAISAA